MAIFLINLENDHARLAAQARQFASCGIAFERIVACESGELNRFRWWCAVLRPVTKGELGCAESHRVCYRRLIESREPCATIFEDDVRFDGDVKGALNLANRFCEKNPRAVVLLSRHWTGKAGDRSGMSEAGDLRIEPTDWDNCTESYVIGREAASNLLKRQKSIRVPADWWGYFSRKGWIELHRVVPAVCGQMVDRFPSNIGDRYVAADGTALARLWWRIRRGIGVVVDTLLDGGCGW